MPQETWLIVLCLAGWLEWQVLFQLQVTTNDFIFLFLQLLEQPVLLDTIYDRLLAIFYNGGSRASLNSSQLFHQILALDSHNFHLLHEPFSHTLKCKIFRHHYQNSEEWWNQEINICWMLHEQDISKQTFICEGEILSFWLGTSLFYTNKICKQLTNPKTMRDHTPGKRIHKFLHNIPSNQTRPFIM